MNNISASLTAFHLMWIGVGALTLVAASIACVRLLHWKPFRVTAAILGPMMIITLGYAVPMAVQASNAPSSTLYGTRNVVMHWPTPPKGAKVVYLTFDDGPDPESTPYILSVLLAYHVPAAFFDVGKNIEREPGEALVKEEAQDGMIVADHSWAHPDFQHSSESQQKTQVQEDANLIQKITGVRPKYFRYPYGLRTSYVESHLKQWGFNHSVYWNDAGDDWFPLCPGANAIINRLTVHNPNLHPGSVLLLHDSSLCGFQQLQFLPRLITKLQRMGYTFGMLGTGPYPLTPLHPGHE